MRYQPIQILLIEDNEDHIFFLKTAFERGSYNIEINYVLNGIEAMDYLAHKGKYSDTTLPDFIFLDLNLHKKNGREVLRDIKSNEKLKMIPIIILSTSHSKKDILDSYKLNANSYITKPTNFSGFIEIVRGFEQYWLGIAKIPGDIY